MRQLRLGVTLAVLGVALAMLGGAETLGVTSSRAVQEGARTPSGEEEELAVQAAALLAEARVQSGLRRLQRHPLLDLLAYQHAAEMAERGQVTHFSHLVGVGTKTRVRLAFPQLLAFAENIARSRTPESLHDGLMRSPGHSANRLDPGFTHVGIGVARGGPHELYLTEIFGRAPNPATLASIAALYSTMPVADLPREESDTGEVVEERYTLAPPGEDDPEYWTSRGIDAYIEGRYDEAIDDFRRALAMNPDYAYARFDLARALIAAERPEEAAGELDRYLAGAPEDIDAWAAAGTAALLSGRYGAAEEAFRRVLRDRARDAGAWYNLGLALEYQDRMEDAAGAYSQALFLAPGLAEARDGLRRVRR